jgi:hypothetical protein
MIALVVSVAFRDRPNTSAPRLGYRGWRTTIGSVLLVGRDLLLAAWAIAALVFWLAIVASLVL